MINERDKFEGLHTNLRASASQASEAKLMKKGFTLAEVLITLGIIGIIAALTIPSLVASYQEKATVTKLKKFYSVMSQAYSMAEQEYGDPTGWDLIANDSPEGAQNMAEKFKPFLKIMKEEQYLTTGVRYFLADGSIAVFVVRDRNCASVRGTGAYAQACGLVEYYLKPNLDGSNREAGVDSFQFILTKTGLVPSGLSDDTVYPPATTCLKIKDGIQGVNNGLGCTAWILYNENMDYLKCPEQLSWDGKHKCD